MESVLVPTSNKVCFPLCQNFRKSQLRNKYGKLRSTWKFSGQSGPFPRMWSFLTSSPKICRSISKRSRFHRPNLLNSNQHFGRNATRVNSIGNFVQSNTVAFFFSWIIPLLSDCLVSQNGKHPTQLNQSNESTGITCVWWPGLAS